LDVSIPILAANIKAYGLDANLARVRASGVPVLALEDDRERATQQVKAEIRTAIREDDINSVVLGCAGMVHIAEDQDDTSVKSFSNWRTTKAARQLSLDVYLLSNM